MNEWLLSTNHTGQASLLNQSAGAAGRHRTVEVVGGQGF